jgi:TetR/AcrR family acrAB operon transcriptional repressor
MNALEKILQSLTKLANEPGRSKISLAELARESGVSRPTVRRYVGGQAGLNAFMGEHNIQFSSPASTTETREMVLAAAFRVFAEKGYASTTMDAVAAEANLTKGAVYWHFENKKDLFQELMRRRSSEGISIADERINVAFNASGGDPLRLLAALISRQIDISKDEQDWWRLDFEFLSETRDEQLRQTLAPGMRALLAENEKKIQALQASGALSEDIDINAISILWQSMLIGLGYLAILDPQIISKSDLGSKIAGSLWSGLQPGDLKHSP